MFKCRRNKASGVNLFTHSPYGSVYNIGKSHFKKFIGCTFFKEGILIVCGYLIKGYIYKILSFFITEASEIKAVFHKCTAHIFKCLMENITYINIGYLMLLSFTYPKSVGKEMRKGTTGIGLYP